jgi:hypothetical protein
MVYCNKENVTELPDDREIRNIVKKCTHVDASLLENLRREFIPQLRRETSSIHSEDPLTLQRLPADPLIDSKLKASLQYLETAIKRCDSVERKMKLDVILANAVEKCRQEVGCNQLQPHPQYSDRNKRIRTLKEFMKR